MCVGVCVNHPPTVSVLLSDDILELKPSFRSHACYAVRHERRAKSQEVRFTLLALTHNLAAA